MRLLLALALAALWAAAATPNPDVKEIVRRSVKTLESDWNQAPGFTYRERDVESKHHEKSSIKTYEVVMIDGSPYERLLAIDDRPLEAGERAEQDRKLSEEARKREHESRRERNRRIAKYEKERARDHAMLTAMVSSFDFRLAGDENLDGHDCWVLDANPKRGFEPSDHVTKVLAGMRGRLWIDKRQYQWVRVEAEVFKPVNFFGFIAKVGPGTKFYLEQEPITDSIWLPKRFRVQVKASALGFFDESSSDDETYGDYRPTPNASATLHPASGGRRQ